MLQDGLHRSSFPVFLIAALFGVVCTADFALAKTPEWYRYENSHFLAYSNASEKNARDLLDDLEGFRAAVLQVGNIIIPAAAPKTRVVIVSGGDFFSRYTSSGNVAGFAIDMDDSAILVLSTAGYRDWPETVIRHEYAHVLLDYKNFDYPWWYEEGFAELVSSLKFTEDGRSFLLGGVTYRARYGARPDVDWDDLVAGNIFVKHKVTPEAISSAYMQAWLLAHYATLGNQFENSQKLQQYFDGIRSGELSSDAFMTAFGISANDLWESELKDYEQRMPVWTVPFKRDALDLDYQRSLAGEMDYRPLIDYLQQRAAALRYSRSPRKPLKVLPGQWAEISTKSDCAELKMIDVDENAATITISRFVRGADGELEARMFSYHPGKKRTLWLAAMNGPELGEAAVPWRLQLRSKNLLCLSQPDLGDPLCETILKRCSP